MKFKKYDKLPTLVETLKERYDMDSKTIVRFAFGYGYYQKIMRGSITLQDAVNEFRRRDRLILSWPGFYF